MIKIMTVRKAISKRLRFAIFDRDGFTCKYCGSQSDTVTLHIDHILPVSKGGTNSQENLVTSCADCNLGKSNKIVGVVASIDYLKMKQHFSEQQMAAKESIKAHKNRQKRRKNFDQYWQEMTCTNHPYQQTMNTVFSYVEQFGESVVYPWIEKACQKSYNEQNIGRYISGIRRSQMNQETKKP